MLFRFPHESLTGFHRLSSYDPRLYLFTWINAMYISYFDSPVDPPLPQVVTPVPSLGPSGGLYPDLVVPSHRYTNEQALVPTVLSGEIHCNLQPRLPTYLNTFPYSHTLIPYDLLSCVKHDLLSDHPPPLLSRTDTYRVRPGSYVTGPICPSGTGSVRMFCTEHTRRVVKFVKHPSTVHTPKGVVTRNRWDLYTSAGRC